MNKTGKIRSIVFRNATPILIILIAVYVLVRMPVFFTPANIISLGSQVSVIGIASIGMCMLILTGVTDISVGQQIFLGGVVAIRIFQLTGSMFVATIASMLVCTFVGSINGFVIAKVGVPSMIATLAMQQICKGLASVLIGEDSVISVGDDFKVLGQGKILSIPYSVVFFVVLFTLFCIFINRSRFGRYVYAIGNNADAIGASGVNVYLCRQIIFVLTGMLAGFAGVINASRIGGVQFGMGVGMEFSCIAACVVGGISMSGGKGKMQGVLLGIVIIGSIDQLLRLFNFSVYLYNVVWGVVVLFTVSTDILKNYQIKYERERSMIMQKE